MEGFGIPFSQLLPIFKIFNNMKFKRLAPEGLQPKSLSQRLLEREGNMRVIVNLGCVVYMWEGNAFKVGIDLQRLLGGWSSPRALLDGENCTGAHTFLTCTSQSYGFLGTVKRLRFVAVYCISQFPLSFS